MAKKGNEQPKAVESISKGVCPNHEAVKSVLEAYRYVDTIHVNDEGQWHFMPRPGFTPYTREEILNG